MSMIHTIAVSITLFGALSLSIGLAGRCIRYYIEGIKAGHAAGPSPEFIYATSFLWAIFYFLTH